MLEGLAPSVGGSAAQPRFDLKWRAGRLPSNDWRVSLRQVDEAGHTWAASDGRPLVEKGWLPRYAARRIAWHVLDHAWEIEDRSAPSS